MTTCFHPGLAANNRLIAWASERGAMQRFPAIPLICNEKDCRPII